MVTAQYSLKIGGGGMATVSASGTAWQVVTTSVPCQIVVFSSISTNTAPTLICNSTVLYATTARVGIPVFPGSTSQPVYVYCSDVSQLYIDGITDEAVGYIYYTMGVPS